MQPTAHAVSFKHRTTHRTRRVAAAAAAGSPCVINPGEGLAIPLARLGTVQKVRSQLTEGRLTVLEHTLPPRRLAAPLHRHSREDELSFIVEGAMGVMLGDRAVMAGPGTYVLKARGQWHTFWNAGDIDLRSIELIIPGGLEECFQHLAPMLSGAVPPSRDAMIRAAAEYGIEFDFAASADSAGVSVCRRGECRV